MANNFIKPGRTCTFTAPAGGVTSGAPVLIGSVVVVALFGAAAGASFEGDSEGQFFLPKAAGTAWTEGQALYFDSAAGNFTTAQSATARRAAWAGAAAASADTVGQVRLNNINAPVNVA